MVFGYGRIREMVPEQLALPGRADPIPSPNTHYVTGASIKPPFPAGSERVLFGMGCFWGAERIFWNLPGVLTTAVGYSGGFTPNPTSDELYTGRTGHTETVLIVYDPSQVSFDRLLKEFWEQHDPTQGMRQGNDVGTQYRSAIYVTTDRQRDTAIRSRDLYQARLREGGFGDITTEIDDAAEFYYAEEYHQQYLAKNPNGYCNHGFCQVSYPSTVSREPDLEVPESRSDGSTRR